MTHQVSTQWIPIATTSAGSTLTWQNWQDCGIQTLAFHLDALLIKPGMDVLRSFQSLRDYTGWSGKHILNVCCRGKHKNGVLTLASPFDGARVSVTYDDLCALIIHLAPDQVIVPIWLEEIWLSNPYHESMNTWLACHASMYQSERASSSVYVVDEVEQSALPQFASQVWFESDRPAQDALAGFFNTEDGHLNISDSVHEQSFIALDVHCACSVCTQGLTRAYLHHLYQHTPLLAYRFLMMHHVFASLFRP